ncbi:hypothetical protein BSZ40_05845 [Buchananella hordeovulneris]|uniref:VWA domain-containing protein n=1 Tax=Buchananella hordeovulneris TaxID=52770 RepID=A0A1Q5PVT6_9ACTO|nr:hypothetical protein BSZ40_05845 [Buchananella hordeovulneris]
MVQRAEVVAREDLLQFLNAAFVSTGQAEFYHSASEQHLTMAFLHEYVCGNYRRVYARLLAAGINDFNAAEIVFRLLATGRQTPADFREEENALVRAAVRALPPPRFWKLARRLQRERINNRRTRALVRDYLADHPEPEFQAVKYRRKVAAAARHTHLRLPGELPEFLFTKLPHPFTTELFETYRQARYSRQAALRLPASVAAGFAAQHGIAVAERDARTAASLTDRERLRADARLTEAASPQLRAERLSPTEIAAYLLSLPEPTETQLGWLAASAAALLARSGPLPLPGPVAAVLDNSYSASGSRERRRHPLAVAWSVDAVLRAACTDYIALWTHPHPGPMPVAAGQTNLTERLLDALAAGARTVVVVSDGVENDPPGAFAAALAAVAKLCPQVRVIHLNPVFDPDLLAVRSLSPALPALGLRAAEELPLVLHFAAYAAATTTLAELKEHLAGATRRFLGGVDV